MTLFNIAEDDQSIDFSNIPGFRLYKLEVKNWGTFHKNIYIFSPNGDTTLLTGEVGSGKSTLIDALITLLIPPRKINYNKAADSSAKERTLLTYFKGNYGQRRDSEGIRKPESLRDIDHYSVLLATFHDHVYNRYVTLAQFFWYPNSQKLERFYVIANRELSISHDFSHFEKNIAQLKKRLKVSDGIQVKDDYKEYARNFCDQLGITHENALDLFQQTISMKKVEALSDFVKTNMLEVPNTAEEVKKLINHYQDLDSAHGAVLKAKNQVSMLQPIVVNGEEWEKVVAENKLNDQKKEATPPWFAEQKILLLEADTTQLKRKLEYAIAAEERARTVLGRTQKDLNRVREDYFNNGGGSIDRLQEQIIECQQKLIKVDKARDNYSTQADLLGLSVPDKMDAFIDNLGKLPELRTNEEKLQVGLKDDMLTAKYELKIIQSKLTQLNSELTSLRSRKTSIPSENIYKRNQLCEAIKVSADELPFAGELMEVREQEAQWEGAIERLLHGFSLSLLVPEKYYQQVAQWVDKTHLAMRLVYYRVQSDIEINVVGSQNKYSVPEKLNIKPDTPFGMWLTSQLRKRFNHVCCENMDQFRREPFAITRSGQIKTGGHRHEKDDRRRIDDSRNFVLGFSSQKKIAALEEDVQTCNTEYKYYKDEMSAINDRLEASESRIRAIKYLEGLDDFAEIDRGSIIEEIAEKKARKANLEENSDILKEIRKQLEDLQEKEQEQKNDLDSARDRVRSLEENLDNNDSAIVTTMQIVAEKATDDMRHNVFPLMRHYIDSVFGPVSLDLFNINSRERSFMEFLNKETSRLYEAILNYSNEIVKLMMTYKHVYVLETRELTSSIESLPDYIRIYRQLIKDDLPRLENHFKKLLNKNTINQIALFQTQLNQEQEIIKERIEKINVSMSKIDFNPSRYIRIEHDSNYDDEIKKFRIQLRDCIEGALAGPEDDQYAEEKFLQVKAIIERFKGRPGLIDTDDKWTKKVTDVRNWFLFSASERLRDTNEEYEHYTDSAGKSGGQKEKLAYTILAASLVYNFELDKNNHKSFRFVVIDEAFLKSSDDAARFGLDLFKQMGLQLLIVTPLSKISTIEKFISWVGFIKYDDMKHQSTLINISKEEYEIKRTIQEELRRANVV